ncbi:MAG: HigA family addiction module antidote protein [Candidatus Omnitrophica bacterium]|nr:HigA family addiction module antidote protein [Candidatus Omnitrophota bacterium]
MIPKNRIPNHPGEVLLEEFLVPKKMSQIDLARKMHVSIQRINTLINGKRDVSPETAILLSRVLGTTPEFWMNLQVTRDLASAQQSMALVAH